jgi:Septum formation/Domain of unknown function (DUF4190)
MSLIFGIVGLIGGPVAVICGIIGLRKAKEGQGGRGLAIAGLALSAAWLLLTAVIAFYFAFQYFSTPRLHTASVQVGDCLTKFPEHTRAAAETGPCDAPHVGEVFAQFNLPSGDYPGGAVIEKYDRLCESELASDMSSAIADIAEAVVFGPTEEKWRDGDRALKCVARLDPPRSGPLPGLRSPASYFKVGDCFGAMPVSGQDATLVDCEEPHAAEVIAVFVLPDGDFPGPDTVEEYTNRCEGELAAYSPDAADDPSIRVRKNYPDEKSWGLGHRSVNCIASFKTPRAGSLKR